jgi:MFS family permease
MSANKNYPWLLFAICFLSVALGAMDSVLSAAYLPEILKDMGMNTDEDTAARTGAWINFSFLAGGTVGGIILSFLSDRLGRRIILALSLLLYGAGSGLGIFVSSWELFAATRFIVGAGVGAALVVSAVAIADTWVGRTKAIALGILSIAYPVGIIGSGLITSNISSWKMAFTVGAIPVLLSIPAYLLVKETLREAQGGSTAKKVSLADHSGSLISGMLVYGTMLIGLWSAFAWLPTWVQSLIGEDTAGGQSQRGMAVTLLGMGGLVGGLVSGWLANRWGHKLIQGICFVLCLLLSFLLFKLETVFSTRILIGSAAMGLCFGVSQGVLNDLIPNLFPLSIRSTATGLCFHAGRAFTAIAVFFVGAWAVSLGGFGNAIFIFSAVYAIGLVALLFMKKTSTTSA